MASKGTWPVSAKRQVLTNDPKRTRFELVVYGDVVSSYRIEPATIVFSGLAPNGAATGEARVYSYASDNLAIIDPQFSDKSTAQFYDLQIATLSAEQLKEDKGAKSGCSIKVTVKPGLPAGPFGERIRFHLNTPGDPEAEVTVEGRVNSPIEVSGANWDNSLGMLSLGTVHSREGAKSVIYLTLRGDALKQADVRLDKVLPETLKVTVGKTEKFGPDAARVPLTIEVPAGSRPEDHLGTQLGTLARIFINTGLSEPKQMRLLVRYAVEE